MKGVLQIVGSVKGVVISRFQQMSVIQKMHVIPRVVTSWILHQLKYNTEKNDAFSRMKLMSVVKQYHFSFIITTVF